MGMCNVYSAGMAWIVVSIYSLSAVSVIAFGKLECTVALWIILLDGKR